MKVLYTECAISMNGESPLYAEGRVTIRIDDEGGGPYLVIRGCNDGANDANSAHDIFLQSDEEIDEFARVCKNMLRQANEVIPPLSLLAIEAD